MEKIGWYDKDGKTRKGLPPAALDELAEKIEKLCEELFERDEDGDLPVRWYVFDRTMCQPLRYNVMPHFHKATREEVIQAFRDAAQNVEQAGGDLKQVIREVDDLLKKRAGR
jgi:hypothetical protein